MVIITKKSIIKVTVSKEKGTEKIKMVKIIRLNCSALSDWLL